MNADIKLTITRLTPIKVTKLMGVVRNRMSDNPNFPDPEVPLSEMSSLKAQLDEAIALATDGSRLAKIQRDDLMERAKDQLRKQANYVRAKAHGDRAILESSGFELQRQRERIGVPEAPYLHLSPIGASGMLKLRWNRVRGAKAFKIFMRPPGGSTFELHTVTTQASHVVEGLISHQPYSFRVSSIGAAGEGLMSGELLGYAA